VEKSDGIPKGREVGSVIGMNIEPADGPDGSALGTVDGRGVERVDGITNGRDDGLVVWTKVGAADGLDGGNLVEIEVGIGEGRCVGNSDMSGVGRYVCLIVGFALCADDG
jgi:hypothetical protein